MILISLVTPWLKWWRPKYIYVSFRLTYMSHETVHTPWITLRSVIGRITSAIINIFLIKMRINLPPVNEFRTRNGGHRWQVNKTKTNLLHRKNPIFVISWLKTVILWNNLQNKIHKTHHVGAHILNISFEKKVTQGFHAYNPRKARSWTTAKAQMKLWSLWTCTTRTTQYLHSAQQ